MTARNTVPSSRVSLTYDTKQPDQPRKEKELPLRLLVVGDLTGRAWKPEPTGDSPPPAGDELDSRKVHDLNGNNLDAVMAKLDIAVELRGLTNHVDKAGGPFDVTIPIKGMADFEPGAIVHQVPATRRLLHVRKLLLELQAHVDNNKQFRRLVRELTSPGRAQLLEQLRATFTKEMASQLRVPTAAELDDGPLAPPPPAQAAAPTPPTPTPPPSAPPAPPAPPAA